MDDNSPSKLCSDLLENFKQKMNQVFDCPSSCEYLILNGVAFSPSVKKKNTDSHSKLCHKALGKRSIPNSIRRAMEKPNPWKKYSSPIKINQPQKIKQIQYFSWNSHWIPFLIFSVPVVAGALVLL